MILNFRSSLPASAEQVYNWLRCKGSVARQVSPWRCVKFLSEGNGRIELLVRPRLFWRKWILEQKDEIPGLAFSERQIEGPYSYWLHRYRLYPQGNECDLEEEVEWHGAMDREHLNRLLIWKHATLAQDLMTYARYSKHLVLRILVSGSTGLVGRSLCAFLRGGGHEVVRLVRTPSLRGSDTIYWNPHTGEVENELFEGFDAVIHLAGDNISTGRWTPHKKESLFLSRCRDTWFLSQILNRLARPPKTFICASAIGFYGSRDEESLTEKSAQGSGFLADLCEKWERAACVREDQGVRVVHARFGAILSPAGGMLGQMLPVFRWGLGGRLGSGRQIISWIAIDDVMGALYHALMKEEVAGALNLTTPHPVTQRAFAEILAHRLGRKAVLALPRSLLQMAFGQMANEVLLASARVLPKRLEETGYLFRYPTLEEALKHLIC